MRYCIGETSNSTMDLIIKDYAVLQILGVDDFASYLSITHTNFIFNKCLILILFNRGLCNKQYVITSLQHGIGPLIFFGLSST